MHEPVDAFRFLASDGEPGADYRALVEALAANADRFGERMTLGDLTSACEQPPNILLERLGQLVDWGVVDEQHNGQRLTSLADLRLREFTYDILPAGRIAWDAAQAIEDLAHEVGKLSILRVRTLGSRLARLQDAALADPFAPERLREAFEDVEAEVRRLRDEINGFRKELDQRLRPETASVRVAASSQEFIRFRDLVLAHIADFQNELPPLRRHLMSVLGHIDSVMDRHLVTLSGFDTPPGMDSDAARARRLERLHGEWSGIKAWLTDETGGQDSRWEALNARLVTAINRLVDSAQRLAARDRGRIDRTARLRSWTVLPADANTEDCERLWMAVTGRFPARHLGGQPHDPHRDWHWAPRQPWALARHAPVSAHLLRIGSRGTSNAPGARVRDTSVHDYALRAERRESRRERARLLTAVAFGAPRQISELGCADPETAELVSSLILQALAAGRSDEPRSHHDDLVIVTVPKGQETGPSVPLARLLCRRGTLLLPDIVVELVRTDDPAWTEISGTEEAA
jgi:uncharacterized protein (TIGR02677 family)